VNFQNVGSPVVKRAVVPKRGAFIFADYKAIEPRIAAYFMSKLGHPEFAEQLRAGVDPYTAVAKMVTGKVEITDEERQTWKVMFLSLMYGGGSKTIQLQFGGTSADARSMIRKFHEGWPAVRELSDRVQAAALKRGYIIGVDGRHLHPEPFGEHKLSNKLVQGSAAGIMKRAILGVHRHLREHPELETRMVSVIHDELIGDAPLSELPYFAEHLPTLMRQGFEHIHEVVPILVDIEVSVTSWAEKQSYEAWTAELVSV
jgi:DNA polymerase I